MKSIQSTAAANEHGQIKSTFFNPPPLSLSTFAFLFSLRFQLREHGSLAEDMDEVICGQEQSGLNAGLASENAIKKFPFKWARYLRGNKERIKGCCPESAASI